MSRDELNAAELDELRALDRILAREPVGEEHLELAALVDSVRAGAPRMTDAFAERLDAQLAHAARPAPRRLARPRLRRLALAGGGLVAAAVAFTIVISGGVLNGSSKQRLPYGAVQTPSVALPRTSAGTAAPSTSHSAPTSAAATLAPAGAAAATPAPSGRLVSRSSMLTLATPPADLQTLAARIVAATEHEDGVVASSNVAVQGSASYANFTLRVPGGHLGALIADLSRLAGVRALTQSTDDITASYQGERARLADNLRSRTALRGQLATAATAAIEASLQRQLSRLQTTITLEQRTIARLLTEGRTATLQVNVVPGASAKRSAVGALGRGWDRALHALEAILAIALIAFAIVLPFAVTGLALWWAATAIRQRSRERAMRTA